MNGMGESKGVPSFSKTVPSRNPFTASPVYETWTSVPVSKPDWRSVGTTLEVCCAPAMATDVMPITACLMYRSAMMIDGWG